MNPILDNLSSHLKYAIGRSISLATTMKHGEVTPFHMLFALLQERGGIAAEILQKSKIQESDLQSILDTLPQNEVTPNPTDSLRVSLPDLNEKSKQALEKAMILAYEYGHNYIGTEHLLYGLLAVEDSLVKKLLTLKKIQKQKLIQQIEAILGSTSKFPEIEDVGGMMEEIQEATEHIDENHTHSNKKRPKQKPGASALQMFTTCLTDKVVENTLDPVIGREKEILRLIHILCRRNKNNPVLVGEPGVGKTAIVEGLAKKIVEGSVPDILKQKKIYSLDLTLLISGTIYRGEFEGRLKQLIDEVSANPNAILFIDEIHNIIGTGSNQGTMDAGNMLKPALARGKLHCIGATTYDEYKKYIGSDAALERRFQAIFVEEPTLEETLQILHGIKRYYEDHHQVEITGEALEKAVELSSRYIHDNFLPDKAVDLLDEAGASVRVGEKSDEQSLRRMALESKLTELREKKENAILEEKFEQAMKIKKEEEYVETELQKLSKHKTKTKKRPSLLPIHVAETLARRLGLHPKVFLSSVWEKFESLEKNLNHHIIGQEKVITSVVHKLQQTSLRPKNSDKPLASFLFAGPTGVGKTALAKALAKEYFHDDKALIQFDMSEFSEGHSISKILGSPAGYIGHKERNRFTEHMKKRPYTVILFDEIDKAHPDVTKLLLQILDEGTLTDSGGVKIRLRHSIIILTTNAGEHLFKSGGIGFGSNTTESFAPAIQAHFKEVFGSSLMSRLENISLFEPLQTSTLKQIIRKHVEELQQQLRDNLALTLTIDDTVLEHLTNEVKKVDQGARQIENIVYQRIGNNFFAQQKTGGNKKKYRLSHKNGEYLLL